MDTMEKFEGSTQTKRETKTGEFQGAPVILKSGMYESERERERNTSAQPKLADATKIVDDKAPPVTGGVD